MKTMNNWLNKSNELGQDVYSMVQKLGNEGLSIKRICQEKIKAKIKNKNSYTALYNELDNLKNENNIDFLNDIILTFNDELKTPENRENEKEMYQKVEKEFVSKYDCLKKAVFSKEELEEEKNTIKNKIKEEQDAQKADKKAKQAENKKQKARKFQILKKRVKSVRCPIIIFVVLAFIIGLVAGNYGKKSRNVTEIDSIPPVVDSIPPVVETISQLIVQTEFKLKAFGKINNKDVLGVDLTYNEKGLIFQQLLNAVGNANFVIDSIVVENPKQKFEFEKNGDASDSKNLFALIDTLNNNLYKGDMQRTTDSLKFFVGTTTHKCFKNDSLIRVATQLQMASGQIKSISINNVVTGIDNNEFFKFNQSKHKRDLKNTTYLLWLLAQIQNKDTTKTIKY